MGKKFLAAIAAGLLLASCSGNDAPEAPDANEKDATFSAIAKQYLDTRSTLPTAVSQTMRSSL